MNKVDVLAVLDRYVEQLATKWAATDGAEDGGPEPQVLSEACQARAAVAELIEEANNLLSIMPISGGWHATEVAAMRQALARVQGGVA